MIRQMGLLKTASKDSNVKGAKNAKENDRLIKDSLA